MEVEVEDKTDRAVEIVAKDNMRVEGKEISHCRSYFEVEIDDTFPPGFARKFSDFQARIKIVR